jgi:hypothetical protein
MNLVSPTMRFRTHDMTGRIASALGLDPTAKRSMLIVCSAICLGLAFPTSSFAQRKALATCEKEWRANKAFNQAAGITERDWVAKCRADSAKKPADAAAPISVPLKKSQVSTVCDGRDWCQKVCGLDGRYTCSFGCGSEGCSGQCMNCSSRRVNVRTIQTVVANSKRPWQ